MKILSEGKFRNFDGFQFMGIRQIAILETEDNASVRCTPDHLFLTDSGIWKEAQFLTTTDVLNGHRFKKLIHTNEEEKVYDAINVEETQSFYVEDLTAHNCSFLYIDECCAGDTKVTVKDSETGKIEEITLEELYNRQENI